MTTSLPPADDVRVARAKARAGDPTDANRLASEGAADLAKIREEVMGPPAPRPGWTAEEEAKAALGWRAEESRALALLCVELKLTPAQAMETLRQSKPKTFKTRLGETAEEYIIHHNLGSLTPHATLVNEKTGVQVMCPRFEPIDANTLRLTTDGTLPADTYVVWVVA